MTDAHNIQAILLALFELSRQTCHISATTLAAAAHTTPTAAARTLVELERRGLVDATRARLTMAGLVAAAQLQAGSGSGGPALDLQAAQRAGAAGRAAGADTRVPVAARSTPPPATPERPSLPAAGELTLDGATAEL